MSEDCDLSKASFSRLPRLDLHVQRLELTSRRDCSAPTAGAGAAVAFLEPIVDLMCAASVSWMIYDHIDSLCASTHQTRGWNGKR